MPDHQPSIDAMTIGVADGRVTVYGGEAGGAVELSWPDHVTVHVNGERISGNRCVIEAGAEVRAVAEVTPARCDYVTKVSPDKLRASLRVRLQSGRHRRLVDRTPAAALLLAVEEEPLAPPAPTVREALAALQSDGILFGIDEAAVAAAIAEPGTEHVVALGREAVPGRNGYLQALVDFDEVRLRGVAVETPLLRRVPRRDGQPGMDVTGRELAVRPVRDVRIKLGAGAKLDESGLLAISNVDGSPWWDGDAFVEVRHELVLNAVDTATGDVEFCGSLRVEGDVGEGRRVVARHELVVEGSVDRAYLESGGHMEVRGSIMSSVLRAGGRRAVAAGIFDRVAPVPAALAEAATRARELRDAAEGRGQELSHGLSLQLIFERLYRSLIAGLLDAAAELRKAGAEHTAEADQFETWHRLLQTAAVNNLGADAFIRLLDELSRKVEDIRRAVKEQSDLVVNYMQSSEAEATGRVTLAGKGIFNSRIVAWGGMEARYGAAVVRGGSIVTHGPVQVSEIGSPGGTRMTVQLGRGARLESSRVYAGTVVVGPGHTHRFIADRSHVRIGFDDSGMRVESLAA